MISSSPSQPIRPQRLKRETAVTWFALDKRAIMPLPQNGSSEKVACHFPAAQALNLVNLFPPKTANHTG